MAEAPDVDTLKRRGRRRLVGAVALVLLAVIVLPMVFDQQPKRSAPPISVRIPAESESGSVLKPLPNVAPEHPATKPEPAKPEPTPPPKAAAAAAAKAAEAKAAAQAKAAAETKAAAEAKAKAAAEEKAAAEAKAKAKAEQARARAALAGKEYAVPVAALAERSSVRRLIARLKAAKLPYYTEPIATAKGEVTRVRAGPFASRAAAEKALRQLRRMGLKPGEVIDKS